MRDLSRRFSLGWGKPVLTAGDGEILRVAHAYRNDIYHEDHHTEAALAPVTTAAIRAVASGWMRSLPSNYASSHGVGTPLMDRLLARGYDTSRWGAGAFSLYEGARAVAAWVTDELPIDLNRDRSVLAEDVAARVDWATAMVDWLAGPWGPGRDRIDPGLRWHDLWRQHEGDPELLALDEARAAVLDELFQHDRDEPDEELQARARAADQAYEVRLREILTSHTPTLTLKDLPNIRRQGIGLADLQSMHVLLARYRSLDLEMRVYEEVLTEMAVSWDRYVEEESDRLRGK